MILQTGMLVRVEGIVTQLVFEHSLRIRMKAETESSGSTPSTTVANTNGTATPADTASLAGSSTVNGHGESGDGEENGSAEGVTPPSSTLGVASTMNGKQAKKGEGAGKTNKEGEGGDKFNKDGTAKASNLIGKINNLVSTDLNNIVEGRDFLFIRKRVSIDMSTVLTMIALEVLYVPVQIIGSALFLYKILGWR